MRFPASLAICAVFLVASCADINGSNSGASQGQLENVPERVLAIAAPYQNLTDIRVDPVDGCYVWRHNGPVESTYLPLRTREGNPICTSVTET